MTTKTNFNGLVLQITSEGGSWRYDIFDPETPEVRPIGVNYTDLNEAKDASVYAAINHLGKWHPTRERSNEKIVWVDSD